MENKVDNVYQEFSRFVCGLMFIAHKDQTETQDDLAEYLNKLNYSDFVKIFEIITNVSKYERKCENGTNVFTDIGECFVVLIYDPQTIVLELDDVKCVKLILDKHNNLDTEALQEWCDENESNEEKVKLLRDYIKTH